MTKPRIDGLCVFVTLVLLTTAAYTQSFSVLYNFGTKSGDPCNPDNSGIVAQGPDGSLYSAAPSCGAHGDGAIFKITLEGALTVLHSFNGTDGRAPYSGLRLGTDGNFYGTTSSGGASGSGTLFKITPSGSLTVLHNFTNGSDGGQPFAPPIQGIDGNFYGTTVTGGGSPNCSGGCGIVYKITSQGTLTTLHRFANLDGAFPYAPLIQATDGNFYGVASSGGGTNCEPSTTPGGCGTIFKLTPSGGFTLLHALDYTEGRSPLGPLVQGNDGKFYGTARFGGSTTCKFGTNPIGCGTIFKLTSSGQIAVFLTFISGGPTVPIGGLVQATDGNFYGTTAGNGGTIFRITPTSSFSVLSDFGGTKGNYPHVTLLQHTDGALYGDTVCGGTGTTGGCGGGVFYRWSASLPAFVSLLPNSGKVGAPIEFLGQGFISTSTVSFHGTTATPTSVSATGTYLTTTVPDGATTGFVTVTTSGGTLKSNKMFRIIPQITSFLPISGPASTSVAITGISLTQTTKVTFGGVVASFTVNSDTKVTATIPSGAVTGKIAITTPGGTATSSGMFTVTKPAATLTGYCWGTVIGGAPNQCGVAQDLTQCPVGQPAITPTTVAGCLPPQSQVVDISRACSARNSSGLTVKGECVAVFQ